MGHGPLARVIFKRAQNQPNQLFPIGKACCFSLIVIIFHFLQPEIGPLYLFPSLKKRGRKTLFRKQNEML